MKYISVTFEDEEMDKLNAMRRKMTWRRFILKGAGLPYNILPFEDKEQEHEV